MQMLNFRFRVKNAVFSPEHFFEGKFHVMSHVMSGYFWSKKRSKIRTLKAVKSI